MAINAETSIASLAAIVSEALVAGGIDALLCGGAAVSIWSHNAYQSHDLDFVTQDNLRDIEQAIRTIGFRRDRGRHFTHPATVFTVEFPRGPVMVGDQPVTDHALHQTAEGRVRLLTPTDAVKDRLAAFLHWGDRQGVDQAIEIIRRQPVDLARVTRWALCEPHPAAERFAVIRSALEAAVPPGP